MSEHIILYYSKLRNRVVFAHVVVQTIPTDSCWKLYENKGGNIFFFFKQFLTDNRNYQKRT